MKHHVLLQTRRAGLPHDLRFETTAPSREKAMSNALHYLRTKGPELFNVPARTFVPHYIRCKELMRDKGNDFIALFTDPASENWSRAMDLRRS